VTQYSRFVMLALIGLVACGEVANLGSGMDAGGAGTGGAGGHEAGASGKHNDSGAGGAIGAGASGATSAGAGGAIGAGAGGVSTNNGATGGIIVGGGFGENCGGGGCVLGGDAKPVPPPGPVYCGGSECTAASVCCLLTQTCFDPVKQPGACAAPPQDDDSRGRKVCSSNADCKEGFYCQGDSAGCQGTGHCNPIDNCGRCFGGDCTVCGCDGNTYASVQEACMSRTNAINGSGAGCGERVVLGGGGASGAGVTRTVCAQSSHCASNEACCTATGYCYLLSEPERCLPPPAGTRAYCKGDNECFEGEYCYSPSCAGPGGCKARGLPEMCGVVLAPVCGCDGTTYTSAECAASRGVRVAASGTCQ